MAAEDGDKPVLLSKIWGAIDRLDEGTLARAIEHIEKEHKCFLKRDQIEAYICDLKFYNSVTLIELHLDWDGEKACVLMLQDPAGAFVCLDHTHESIYEFNLSKKLPLDLTDGSGAAEPTYDDDKIFAYLDFYFTVVSSSEGWLNFYKSTREVEAALLRSDRIEKTHQESLQAIISIHGSAKPFGIENSVLSRHRKRITACLVWRPKVYDASIDLDMRYGVVKINNLRAHERDVHIGIETDATRYFSPPHPKSSLYGESITGKEFVRRAQLGLFEKATRVIVMDDVEANGQTFSRAITVRAMFQGNVNLQNATFTRNLDFSGSIFQKDFNLANANIEGALLLNHATIKSATALRRNQGRFNLDHITLRGPFRATDLRVGGRQRIHGDTPIPEVGESITAFSAQIAGEVNLSGLQAGEVNFESAIIHGNLTLSSSLRQDELATQTGTSSDTPGDLQETSVEELTLDFANIDGDVFLEGITAHNVMMRGTKARGNIALSPAARTDNPRKCSDYKPTEIKDTLELEHAQIDGKIDARGMKLGNENTLKAAFVKAAEIRLDCYVVGREPLESSRDLEAERAALSTDCLVQTKLTGDVILEGCEISGGIKLSGMSLMGSFYARFSELGGHLEAAPIGQYATRISKDFQFNGAVVKGGTFLQGIQVGGRLDLSGSELEELHLCSIVRRYAGKQDNNKPDQYPVAPIYFISHTRIEEQLDAEGISVEGPADLTGIQVGGDPQTLLNELDTFEFPPEERYTAAVNFTNAVIGGELTFWTPMILDQRYKVLASLTEKEGQVVNSSYPDLRVYADACIRTRISGDLRLEGIRTGSWLGLTNVYVTHRILLSNAHIGADIECRWPTDRPWPNETMAAHLLGTQSYSFSREDRRSKTRYTGKLRDESMSGTIQIAFGRTQCCHLNMESINCQGDGQFSGIEIHDLWHRRQLFLPSVLARGCQFAGNLQFHPWLKRRGQRTSQTEPGGRNHNRYAIIPGTLDLSFSEAKLLSLNAETFQNRCTDYQETYNRMYVSTRLRMKYRDLRERMTRGRTSEPDDKRFHPYLNVTMNRMTSARGRKDERLAWKDLRDIDMTLYGLKLNNARIGQIEFAERTEGKQKYPHALDMHGLEVQRWDIQPEHFQEYLECEPSFQQSSYLMVHRELRDQGYELASKKVYRTMRSKQAALKRREGKIIGYVSDLIEQFFFGYFTQTINWRLMALVAVFFLFSWQAVFYTQENILVRSDVRDAVENDSGTMRWSDGPVEARQYPQSERHGEWTEFQAAAMTLRYHIPIINLHSNEKWIVRDYGPVIVDWRKFGVWFRRLGAGVLDTVWLPSEWIGPKTPVSDLAPCTAPGTDLAKPFDVQSEYCSVWEISPEDYATIIELLSYIFITIIVTIFAVSVIQRRAAGQQAGGQAN